MPYQYEDIEYWIERVLPLQLQTKRYVTVEQCKVAWGLASKSAASYRLQELVRRGLAEKVRFGSLYHYHIKEEE